MVTIGDIINVYKESGKEECIAFVCQICEVDSTEALPREYSRRSSLSIIAKYKNLTKQEFNDSAKEELKRFLDSDFKSLMSLKRDQSKSDNITQLHEGIPIHITPIGYIRSVFQFKNGTPRQSGVVRTATGKLTVDRNIFNNPEHSLIDLNEFSHVWIIFWFHKNNNIHRKAKVKPPRLDGGSTGVFSTRSPYRPNPIGLTLAKLESIEADTIYLSGIDIVDGTPVLDIKPYIACYDQPSQEPAKDVEATSCSVSYLEIPKTSDGDFQTKHPASVSPENKPEINADFDMNMAETRQSEIATWIEMPPIKQLDVRFTPNAEAQLFQFSASAKDPNYRLKYLADTNRLKQTITDILKADPRSTYRRKRCDDKLYFFVIDRVHVTCWFDDSHVEILRLKSISDIECTNFNDGSCCKQI